MNPFTTYIWILGYKMHIYSIVFFFSALLLGMVRVRLKPPHIKAMISMGVCMSEYYFYDILFGLISGRHEAPEVWYKGVILYSLVLVGIICVLSILNDRYHFFKPDWKLVGLGVLIQAAILSILWFSGWFNTYILWGKGLIQEDPHNWLLALGKAVSLLMWLPLIGEERHVIGNGLVELHRKSIEKWLPPQKWWHEHKISEVTKYISNGDEIVLDLGCGCGDMFDSLLNKGKYVIALDNDLDIIEYISAGKGSKNIQLMLGDAECIELPDSFVDVVLALDILEHLDYPSKCLVEIKRILKPGGKLILSVPHNTLLWRFIWWGWTQIVPYGEHKNYTKGEVVSIMESSGINVLRVYSTHFGCLLIAIGEVSGVER